MRGRDLRLIKNNHAVNTVISFSLTLVIFFSAVGTVFLWGLPVMEQAQSNAQRDATGTKFDIIACDTIPKLISAGSDFTKVEDVFIEEGYLSVDPEGDQLITSYVYDEDYGFNITSLTEDSITIDMASEAISKADFYWLSETCFLKGTKVAMSDGNHKSIEDVQVGDLVKSYDEEKDCIVDCEVTYLFNHESYEMADYYLVINDFLKVTPNHLFYVDGEWIYANNLCVGDNLFCKDVDNICKVHSIKRVFVRVETYNLEVEKCHNYFVNLNGKDVLAHNDQTIYKCRNKFNPAYEGDASSDGLFDDGFQNLFSTSPLNDEYEYIQLIDAYNVSDCCRATVPEGSHQYHLFEFDIAEDPDEINSIYVQWFGIGYNNFVDNPRYEQSLWIKVVDGAWDEYDSSSSITSDFTTLECTINSLGPGHFSRFIDNGVFRVGVQCDTSVGREEGSCITTDFIQVIVTTAGDLVQPSDPIPADNADNVPWDSDLYWNGTSDALFDVYLKENDSNFGGPVVEDHSSNFYDPGDLGFENYWYWRIVAKKDGVTIPGPIWNFTTEDAYNRKPSNPDKPFSSESYEIYYASNDYEYSFGTNVPSDPDEDNILIYNWSWGDGTYSEEPSNSGSHFWNQSGIFEIRVKAIDIHGAESEWSDPLTIRVKNPITSPGDNLDDIFEEGLSPSGGDPYTFSTNSKLEGIVRIDLYSNNYPANQPASVQGEVPFGHIWIFNLGEFKHTISKSSGQYASILQNYGIVKVSQDSGYLDGCPRINKIVRSDGNVSLEFGVMLIRGDYSSLGGSGHTSSKLTFEIKNNYVREHYMNEVYDFKIQMKGDNKEYWYTYLEKFLEDSQGNVNVFKDTDGDDVLEFKSETPPKLIFTSFIVDITLG